MSALTVFDPKFTAGEQRERSNTTTINGYLTCNGSVVSQATYPQLYAQVGLYPNGLNTWTARTSTGFISAVNYLNSLFVAVGTGGRLATSTDGTTWTTRASGTSSYIYYVTYGGVYVYGGAGGALATSTNAITWTARSSGTTSVIYTLTYGNGIYVYAGDGGVLRTSADGITWTARTSGTTSAIWSVIYANGIYVYSASGGVLATSTDAITWTQRASGTTSIIYGLTYGNGVYVYGGVNGAVATSTDAITWTPRSIGVTAQINALTYGAGIFVGSLNSLGRPFPIITSTNGINWTRQFSPLWGDTPGCITYGNSSFVFSYSGGVANDTIYSAAAYTYNPATDFVIPTSNPLVPALTTATANIKVK